MQTTQHHLHVEQSSNGIDVSFP